MTEQPGIIRDLAALVRAVLFGDRTATVHAERIASRAGIGEDDSAEAIEAGLRRALGPVLDREQLGTVLAALEDAAGYRREYQDGDCAGCEELPEGVLCGDYDCDRAVASMYDLLHEDLQEHQGTGGTGHAPACQERQDETDAATAAWEED
jgi:hypothetical protein